MSYIINKVKKYRPGTGSSLKSNNNCVFSERNDNHLLNESRGSFFDKIESSKRLKKNSSDLNLEGKFL